MQTKYQLQLTGGNAGEGHEHTLYTVWSMGELTKNDAFPSKRCWRFTNNPAIIKQWDTEAEAEKFKTDNLELAEKQGFHTVTVVAVQIPDPPALNAEENKGLAK